jgi:hypothetical protein
MALKQTPRPQGAWTGYMNFSPDLVSRDFAEPRAQSLGEQAARRGAAYAAKPRPKKTIAQQNVKTLSAATRNAPPVKRFALAKTEARVVQDQVNKKLTADRIKAAVKAKLQAAKGNEQ